MDSEVNNNNYGDPAAEDPKEKKDINNAGIGDLADNKNVDPSEHDNNTQLKLPTNREE